MDISRRWFIYTLSDPRSGVVRYVGKTFNPAQRLSLHLFYGGKHHTRCSRWLGGLKKAGLKPLMLIIEEGRGDGFDEAERRQISGYLGRGVKLLNHEPGGRGCGSMSEETKRKIGDAHRGRPRPTHVLEAMRRGFAERTISDETRERIRLSKLGHKRSPEAIEKFRAKMLGHTVSEETRRRISAAKKGSSPSKETREKIAATLRGSSPSEETREKLRQAQRARRARGKDNANRTG